MYKSRLRRLIPNRIVNTFWHLPVAWIAAAINGFPARKLALIGVTGTDGKTTTVYLINHILKTAGYKTAMISSVAAEIAGEESDTGFHVTSPHPFKVQNYLRKAVEEGVTHAVLEVTSHAIAQHRFAGCSFDYGVLTNIRPDHLDYHDTFATYLQTKVSFLKGAKVRIVNKDIEEYKKVRELLSHKSDKKNKAIASLNFLKSGIVPTEIITYNIKKEADITPDKLKDFRQPANLPGDYNLSNILAAAATCLNLKAIKHQMFNRALLSFKGVPGRFDEIETGTDFRVIIDFAHTPYALRELLKTLKQQSFLRAKLLRKRGDKGNRGRLIAVFGCAAERGMERRKMGKVSAELAEFTIITAEDPRFESVEKISDEIAKWAVEGGAKELRIHDSRFTIQDSNKTHYYTKISDRQEAINFAVKIARAGDIIALCGKGHERSMNYAGKEIPWSDREAVEQALKSRKH